MLDTAAWSLRAPRAHSFSSLMDIYESNYIRLRKLVPLLDAIEGEVVSRANGALDLHLTIEERCRYTTTIGLTYRIDAHHGRLMVPGLRVRIYHDAQLAEVLACARRRGGLVDRTDCSDERLSLLRRWESNRFLQKWLGFCLHQGHRFGRADDDVASDFEWHPVKGHLP